jgi:transposase
MVESTITDIDKEELESKYKSLQLVERSFDEVKNLIELRPVFHWKTDRVK